MRGAFECTHCGACCKKETSPVNLTLGDVGRIAKFLGREPAELFGDSIRIRPFLDANAPGRFELELGLPKPCTFWKEGRCSIYPARPLNCRLFPYWLFAQLPDEAIAEQTLPGYDCVSNAKVDEPHRAAYREYTKKLGALIMGESRRTDEFMQAGGFVSEVILDGRDDEFEAVLAGPGPGTEAAFTRLVRDAEGRIDWKEFEGFAGALSSAVAKGGFISSEELVKIDGLVSA